MKHLTPLTLVSLLALAWMPSAFAQPASRPAVDEVIHSRLQKKVSEDGNVLSVTVQIKSSSGTHAVGASTLPFTFNSDVLSFPDKPTAGKDYVLGDLSSDTYANTDITKPEAGTVSLNLVLHPTAEGTSVSTTDYVDLATVRFKILNSSKAPELAWNEPELFTAQGQRFKAETSKIKAADAKEDAASSQSDDTLSPAHPNPFNPQTSFTLSVSKEQHVSIVVYNVLGRRVATLHEGTLSAGKTHRFRFDGQDLSSGMYLLRVKGETIDATQELTLLK